MIRTFQDENKLVAAVEALHRLVTLQQRVDHPFNRQLNYAMQLAKKAVRELNRISVYVPVIAATITRAGTDTRRAPVTEHYLFDTS